MSAIILIEEKQVRRAWNTAEEKWYFAIADVVAVLTGSVDPGAYWRKLKERLKKEGNQTVTNCHALKMTAADGRQRLTDVADTEQLLRLIQSVPSPKAEPFKLWLARVGFERLEEIENPELAAKRMRAIYEQKGYSEAWIEKRMRGIAVRDELTDEWKKRGVQEQRDFAILTAEISKATFGMTPSEYKNFKALANPKDNLRDHITDLELIFTMLGEASTTEIAKKKEHGAIMAATVLNRERAVAMSTYIVRAFVRMRCERLTNATLEARLTRIEKDLPSHGAALRTLFSRIKPLPRPFLPWTAERKGTIARAYLNSRAEFVPISARISASRGARVLIRPGGTRPSHRSNRLWNKSGWSDVRPARLRILHASIPTSQWLYPMRCALGYNSSLRDQGPLGAEAPPASKPKSGRALREWSTRLPWINSCRRNENPASLRNGGETPSAILLVRLATRAAAKEMGFHLLRKKQ